MKALVFTGPSRVELLDVDEPIATAGEVIVEVRACGICGSELHGVREPGFRVPPLVMGHEFAGITTDGREVIVNPLISCGQCDLCVRGLDQLCRDRAIVGIHRSGGFGERVAVPVGQLHPKPTELSFENAAMVEPLATALHAWRLVSHLNPKRVGVIGAGTIGLMCLLVAKSYEGITVDVTDLSEERLDIAARLGATRHAQDLEQEYDVVFDAVGSATTHSASIQNLRPGGAAVWLGLLEEQASFDARALVRQEKRVIGSFAYSAIEFGAAVTLAPTLALDWSSAFALADAEQVFTELMNGRHDVVKALVCPR